MNNNNALTVPTENQQTKPVAFLNRETMIDFVNKYSLLGQIDAAVWQYANDTLRVVAMSTLKKVFTDITLVLPGLPLPAEIAIETKPLLTRMKGIPEEFVIALSDDKKTLFFIGNTFDDCQSLPDRSTVDPIPKMKNLPDFQHTYNWTVEERKKLQALLAPRRDRVIALTKEIPESGDCCYDANDMFRILRANSNLDVLSVQAHDCGLCHVFGRTNDMTVNYYMIRIAVEGQEDKLPTKAACEAASKQRQAALSSYAEQIKTLHLAVVEDERLCLAHGKLCIENAI